MIEATPKKTRSRFLTPAIALVLVLGIMITMYATYEQEKVTPIRGKANFNVTYRFRVTNTGPVNLTYLSARIALLKDWDPVQEVQNLIIETQPNRTTTDEYDNQFAWYEFDTFLVNQSLDLVFRANLTLNLLDYTTVDLDIKPYDRDSEFYKFYMAYDQYEDPTDPAIIKTASRLASKAGDNPIDQAFQFYNFSSTYIRYKLLASIRGASFALAQGYGDCDEYTTLFNALSKAVGIPTIGYTAWLAEFQPGFETTDQGAVAHSYPMFYVEGVGFLPVDPTRGNANLFDNWLKTDEQRITLTRGIDVPYRLLKYRWIPQEGFSDPLVVSNYTVKVNSLTINYFSPLRKAVIYSVFGFPALFLLYQSVKARKNLKDQQEKLRKYLEPDL